MNKTKLTIDQQNEVIQRYLNGEMVRNLKEEYGVCDTVIYKLLRETHNVKHGLDVRFATEEQKEQIKQLYLDGKSSVEIGKIFNCTHKPILAILEELGIKRDQARFVRKYELSQNYFDEIDKPNKAYILGLLHADGCNIIDKGTVSIGLQESDMELLEKIRLEIKSEKPLEFIDNSNKHTFGYNYENMYVLKVYSAHMCEQLSSKGIVQNKSLVIGFPEWLSDELISHYVRGVYDGDGSIYRYYRNENNMPITVTITATDSFCQRLKEICFDILGITAGIYDASCHNGITKVFTLSGRRLCKKFLDWIYTDADLYLQRKYDRYCKYYDINNSLIA